MIDKLKVRLDTLDELHKQGYLTDDEYASAKENLLLDAGIDIAPREADLCGRTTLAPQYKKNHGCGCFMTLILVTVAVLGVIMALPQSLIEDVPVLKAFFTEEGRESTFHALKGFIDDLRGEPVQSPDPTLSRISPSSTTPESTPISPIPASAPSTSALPTQTPTSPTHGESASVATLPSSEKAVDTDQSTGDLSEMRSVSPTPRTELIERPENRAEDRTSTISVPPTASHSPSQELLERDDLDRTVVVPTTPKPTTRAPRQSNSAKRAKPSRDRIPVTSNVDSVATSVTPTANTTSPQDREVHEPQSNTIIMAEPEPVEVVITVAPATPEPQRSRLNTTSNEGNTRPHDALSDSNPEQDSNSNTIPEPDPENVGNAQGWWFP